MLIDRFPDVDREFRTYPVDIVIDHMGYADPQGGIDPPGFTSLLRLLETGRCWVKLSAPYRFSGRDVPYDDVTVPVRRLIAAAPARMLWANHWQDRKRAGTGKRVAVRVEIGGR